MSLRGRMEQVAPALGTMPVLVVTCGKTYLAIPGAIVRGVVESAEAIQARIISLFGETCRVTDLAARLGLPPSAATQDARIILCGEHRAKQAWQVDRAIGLTDVDLQRITPLPPHFAGVEQSWFTGLFLFRETVALLLNPGWLLSQPMDAFIAQPQIEGAGAETPAVASEPPVAVDATPPPRRTRKKKPSRKKAAGEDAPLDVLENLVLEESTDVEDGQAPWADA
jgi:hypothetical protein